MQSFSGMPMRSCSECKMMGTLRMYKRVATKGAHREHVQGVWGGPAVGARGVDG